MIDATKRATLDLVEYVRASCGRDSGLHTAEEYLRLQTVVHEVARATSNTVPTERVYVMSLGSNQGNAHVHRHVAPLPPGVPYEEQQFKALMLETNGYIDLSPEEQNSLAAEIRASLPSPS